MTQTQSTDLYAPEVWEDLAQASFTGKAIVATSPAVAVDDTLVGKPGKTVEFPKWMALSELDDLTEGVPMVPEKLKQSASKATIKEAGKAVEITDTADLTGLGNPQDEAIRQFGELAARKVDADLITAAQATVAGGISYADGSTSTASAPLSFTTAAGAGLSWGTFVDATAVAGDEFEPEDWALFVRTEQRVQLLKDDDFIQAANASSSERNVIQRGFIGLLGGSPVYVTNRLATNKGVFVKNRSLGLLYKRRPIVEQDRDILARSTLVTTNLHYATKRLNDKGVIVVTFTPSA
jgi:N4-gp56 family major capsid protein